ncbi:MAG: polysaccharide deacetylase family protein, partial [Candidatus Bathyarchaeota archaeon]|nr:polysaccharide deacetylase family protein [Candidatus Termiticorpusculum sp.]
MRQDVVTMMDMIVKRRILSVFICMLLGLTLIWSAIPVATVASDVSNNKMIALTFDDGPSEYTDQLLDILSAYGAKASFFVVGEKIDTNLDVINKAHSQGCEILGHSWQHDDLTTLAPVAIRQDLQRTNDAIFNAIGVRPDMFRPTYFAYDDNVINAAENVGLALIINTIDSDDWRFNEDWASNPTWDTEIVADMIYDKIMSNVWDGDIVLCHDVYETTVVAMERVVCDLILNGYTLVTVSELLGETEAGKIYCNSVGDWKGVTHTVLPGESLWAVALKYAKTQNSADRLKMLTDIMTINGIKDDTDVPRGMILRIPCTGEVSLYHNWDNGVYTDPTTCENGYWTYTCVDCGFSYVDEIKDTLLGHIEVTETVYATSTEDGYVKVYCSECGAILSYEVLYAMPVFAVFYDANGGYSAPTDDNLYRAGATVAVKVSKFLPWRFGHVFEGWLYDGVIYFGGDSFVMPGVDVVLVAQWGLEPVFG